MCTIGDVLCACFCLPLQQGCNAFHLCAASGEVAIAQFLAPKMKGHVFDCDAGGYSALHWATQEGQLHMVVFLAITCGFDLETQDKVGLLRFLVV